MAGLRGADLAQQIWDIVKVYIMAVDQPMVALAICDAFEERGCDTLSEAEELFGIAYDIDNKKAKELLTRMLDHDCELTSKEFSMMENWKNKL